jgi:hypothetical protein
MANTNNSPAPYTTEKAENADLFGEIHWADRGAYTLPDNAPQALRDAGSVGFGGADERSGFWLYEDELGDTWIVTDENSVIDWCTRD